MIGSPALALAYRGWACKETEHTRFCHHCLVVEVAGVDARRSRAYAAHRAHRGEAHGAEERPRRYDNARRDRRGRRLAAMGITQAGDAAHVALAPRRHAARARALMGGIAFGCPALV